jgi:hypothetical protein
MNMRVENLWNDSERKRQKCIEKNPVPVPIHPLFIAKQIPFL